MDNRDRSNQQHSSQYSSKAPSDSFEDKEQSPALPKGKQKNKNKSLKKSLYLSEVVDQQTHSLIRWLGYGLVLFSLIDYGHTVIPPRFTDPNWELQTIGNLVEQAAVPIVGLMFVFYRHQGYIRRREKRILGFLSWVCLLTGVLYLLMVPLGITDTWRIHHANKTQISTQLSQQRQRLEQLKSRFNQAKTDEQLQQFLASLAPQSRLPQIKDSQTVKEQFLSKISQTEQSIQNQANAMARNQTKILLKNSLKWNLGALIAGVLFIGIWHLTRWTRSRQY